jgi:WD40 repeat protein
MTRLLALFLTLSGLPAVPTHAQSPDANVIRANLAVSDDGATVATSTGTGTLLLWDAATWTLTRRHTADGSQVFGFDFTQDGSFQSGRLLFAVAFRPGTHEVITGGIRMPIVVWDATTGDRRRTIADLP